MDFTHISTKSKTARQRGTTIVEMLIGILLGTLVTLVLVSFSLYCSRSLANLLHYTEMQYASRKALDFMSRDIRRCQSLEAFAPDRLTLMDSDGQPLTYEYSPVEKSLARVKGNDRSVLLTGCDALTFSIYQRPPSSGTFDRPPSMHPETAKVINVSWNCARTILGVTTATDNMMGARIVIRKR